jgi:hypothetical protein
VHNLISLLFSYLRATWGLILWAAVFTDLRNFVRIIIHDLIAFLIVKIWLVSPWHMCVLSFIFIFEIKLVCCYNGRGCFFLKLFNFIQSIYLLKNIFFLRFTRRCFWCYSFGNFFLMIDYGFFWYGRHAMDYLIRFECFLCDSICFLSFRRFLEWRR